MKQNKFNLTALSLIAIMFSCKKNVSYNSETGYESYRYELWKMLLDNGGQFDYIGTKIDSGNYPDYLNQAFDRNHEGIGGIESEGVLNNLNTVLFNIPSPDIVLLGIGGNDLLISGDDPSEPIGNINQIIDLLQSNNPNITIFLEQIAPGRIDIMTLDLTNRIEIFNTQVVAVASNQTDSNSTVVSIDMYSEFKNIYFTDEAHYNKHGSKFIATKYFTEIQNQFDSIVNLNILPLGDSRVEGNRK